MADNRYRSFNWVMYVESLPDNWQEVLDSLHVPILCVLHDRDVWTETDQMKNPEHVAGELKKEHIHGLSMFEGKKSTKQMLEMLEPLGVKYCEPTHNVQSFTRYLIHLDNPEKAQYDQQSVMSFGGAIPDFSRAIPNSELQKIMGEICDFIREKNILEFLELWSYARDHEPDWFTVINNGKAYVINLAIKSNRHGYNANSKEED